MFPLLALLLLSAVGILIALVRLRERKLLLRGLLGGVSVALMSLWLQWTRRNPKVPDQDDVARISIQDAAGGGAASTTTTTSTPWPRAPEAPIRGELVAKGSSWFKDSMGRRLLLRGVNLAATSKLPAEPASQRATHLGFSSFTNNYKNVSFVGRPFPLHEADLHLGRLRAMGLTFHRFLVTWEAVEHDGPGLYDTEYLKYLKDMVRKCREHGISVFIDFHQDVWSRFTGGDGAPAWTLEKVGFALDKLDKCAAALTQQYCVANGIGYPKMVWNSNNSRLAAGTMWTLFFAGNDFAPATQIDGEPVQDYLQRHFVATMSKVAETLKEEPNVIGFDILNEPSVGFVGVRDCRDIGPNKYYVGWRVSPWDAMKLGAGVTCTVDYFSSFMYIDGKRELNMEKACAWQNGPTSCVWYSNGVWGMDENNRPCLLKPHYFATKPDTGRPIDFLSDYGIPFWLAAAKAIRNHIPDATIFVEPILDMTDPSKENMPVLTAEDVGAGGYVWAPHYYDGMTLMTKSFSRYLGMDSVTQKPSITMRMIQKSYGMGISMLKHEASNIGPGGCPVLIGECGIPFDLGGKYQKPLFFGGREPKTAFETGDFRKCTHALDRTMGALEHAQVSYTIWCYQPDNTNEHGDGWNGEDLSLFSRDQVVQGEEDDLFAGGRSLLAVIRPYPYRVAGDVIRFSFHLYSRHRRFDLVFRADHYLSTKETIIFLPKYQYPHGVHVYIKPDGGSYEVNWDTQTLTFSHAEDSSVNHIVVTKVLVEHSDPPNLEDELSLV